jgi:hypothetical protein
MRRRFLTQRRKDAKRYRASRGFLCAFAPLREKYFLYTRQMRLFVQSQSNSLKISLLIPSLSRKPKRSLQRIKSRADLFIRGTLLVIGFDLGPDDLAILIDHVNRWMRDAVNFLPLVSRVAEPVSVDYFVFRIADQGKSNLAFPI